MKIREIIPLLSVNPLFSKTPFNKPYNNKSTGDNDDETNYTPKNFISVNNQSSEIYYYSPFDQKLYVIKIESTLDNTIGFIKFQELKIKIDFEVFKIELNEDSRYLYIVGSLNCLVVDLSPKTVNSYFTSGTTYEDKTNKTIGYEPLSNVSYSSIDNPFSNISSIIKQVEWHPLSSVHLVILYSNNVLKIFNIKNEKEEIIEQTFNLDSLYTFESLKKFKSNKIEKKNIKSFMSFCFGSNINFWSRFTIFLLTSDGEVYNLCPVIPNNCLVESNFYKDFKNHIVFEKNQCNNNNNNNNSNNSNSIKHQQRYYDQQFKWLMSASIDTVPFEMDNVNWLKLSTPPTTSFSLPLLQGPIYKVSENTKSQSQPLKILSISPLVSNLDNNNINNDEDENNNNNNNSEIENKNNNQELSIEDLNSNNSNNNNNNNNNNINNKNNKYSRLVPFIISILLESCECLVNICCQDTIPMWSNIENDNGILLAVDDNSTPKFIDLILYETLDMGLKRISKKNNKDSTLPSYLLTSYPTMKYDQWSDSLYFYHDQGVQVSKFPWLIQIYYEINKAIIGGNNYKNEQEASAIDENMLFDNTQLFTVISNSQPDQKIPIVGIQIFSNIKIGTYCLVLPNTFKLSIFDMDALLISSGNNDQENLQLTSNEIKDKSIRSPLEKFIKNKPAIIGRINLANQFTQKEFLQTLISTKKKIYNLYVYSKELEFELQSRVKTLNELSKQQLQIIDTLKNRIENIKENQSLLNEKLKYLWDKKEASINQVNLLYKTEMEGKPLSNAENELKKTLIQVKGQVNIYNKRLKQISKELDNHEEINNQNNNNNNNNHNDSIDYEELSEDQQIYFKKVINLHGQKIDKDVNKLINIFNSIQITK